MISGRPICLPACAEFWLRNSQGRKQIRFSFLCCWWRQSSSCSSVCRVGRRAGGDGGFTVGLGLSNRYELRAAGWKSALGGRARGFLSRRLLQLCLGHVSWHLALSLVLQPSQRVHKLPTIPVIKFFSVKVRHIRFLWFIVLKIQDIWMELAQQTFVFSS